MLYLIKEYQCIGHQVKCPSGLQCIEPEYICNGLINCQDSSDESPEYCKGKY